MYKERYAAFEQLSENIGKYKSEMDKVGQQNLILQRHCKLLSFLSATQLTLNKLTHGRIKVRMMSGLRTTSPSLWVILAKINPSIT